MEVKPTMDFKGLTGKGKSQFDFQPKHEVPFQPKLEVMFKIKDGRVQNKKEYLEGALKTLSDCITDEQRKHVLCEIIDDSYYAGMKAFNK